MSTTYTQRANRMVDRLANGGISPEEYTRWEKEHTEAWLCALRIRSRHRPPWLGIDVKPRRGSKAGSPLALKYAAAGLAMKKKAASTLIKAVDDQEFVFYPCVFGPPPDRQGDICERGCVKNVPELIESGNILQFHDQNKFEIAWIKDAVQDDFGLRVTGVFHDTVEAQTARAIVQKRMENRRKVMASIGYVVNVGGERFERIGGQTVRILTSINVYEGSLVNIPANPRAEFVSA
jgi:Caudovirus prohead serine protease